MPNITDSASCLDRTSFQVWLAVRKRTFLGEYRLMW